MRALCLVIVCSVLLVGCKAAHDTKVSSSDHRTIDLYGATVELPNNFVHFRGRGIDSLVGDFTRTDGGFRIRYDIGAMAGVFTSGSFLEVASSNSIPVGKLNAIIVVEEVRGAKRAVVSFPETSANFVADISEDSDLEALKRLVLTYKLKQPDVTR